MTYPSYVIDCNSEPVNLPGANLIVRDYRRGGKVIWDSTKFALWLHPDQLTLRGVESNALHAELMKKNVPNANVLDFLLANAHLIPSGWKGNSLYFWGTIYRYPGTDLPHVRFLVWQDYSRRWVWGYRGVSGHWRSHSPALVILSPS